MSVDPQDLVSVLEENGGRLGNKKARQILEEKLGAFVSQDDYEQAKEQLISTAKIKKGKGQGGSIELISCDAVDSEDCEPADPASQGQHLDTLYTSLDFIPGLRAKMNKTTITILLGDDNDKLFCGWDLDKFSYFIQYRREPGRIDASETARTVLGRASSDLPSAQLESYTNKTTLYLGGNVVQVNKVVRRLASLLEDETLGFSPAGSGQEDGAPARQGPRDEDYYLEVATLIKLCVDHGLKWPLKNWRKALGFDDVDSLIVIGSSKDGKKERYREHVVPVSLIKDEAIRLAEKGAPAKAIADFIEHHLYIVHITSEEAKSLNSTDETGFSLKASMPEGWVFGCDPLQRLKDQGIDVSYYYPIPIPKWRPWKKPSIRQRIIKILNTPIV